jgi:hypothetical protein
VPAGALRDVRQVRCAGSDYGVPRDESGFDLAQSLAGHDRGGRPAVILVSTRAEGDFADLIAESPVAGFLPKSELSADAIRRIIDGRAPGATG